MKNHNQIKCPHCDTAFKIDEKSYALILNQIKDKEFKHQLEQRVNEQVSNAVTITEQKLENKFQKLISDKNNNIVELNEKLKSSQQEKDNAIAKALAPLEKENLNLVNSIKHHAQEKDIAIAKALAPLEKENLKLVNSLKNHDLNQKLVIHKLKEEYKIRLKDLHDEKERIKNYKMKFSTKMVGESLEQHCENEYKKYLSNILQNATFKKDNDASSGSKGDYIYRETDSEGNEIVSIMFDMKAENDSTIKKTKNEAHFSKLDKDRNTKGCEYAALVSLLEPENDLYNSGFHTVYDKYSKMVVIRPDNFITLIITLRQLGLEKLKYKLELAQEKSKSIDIANFKDDLKTIKLASAAYLKQIFDGIKDVVNNQDKIIGHASGITKKAEACKSLLINIVTKNSRQLDNEIQGISVEKLTSNNPTLLSMFKSLDDGGSNAA